MGKTRVFVKKIRHTKGRFHAKMGTIKDRNYRDRTEVKDFKKRWQGYTEELFTKGLNDPDNRDVVITDLEPDIQECEVKWALGSIPKNKASGGDRIPADLFQTLNDDAVKVLHSICQQIWTAQQMTQDWKMSAVIPIPKKFNARECSKYHIIAPISHAFKGILKNLQLTLQQYLKRELQYVQAGFRKGRGIRYQIGNLHWVIDKTKEFQKNFYLFDYAKVFACVDHSKLCKYLKRREYQTSLPAF